MKQFSAFLKNYSYLEDFPTCKALYIGLGGQEKLKITLRNFQLLYNGDSIPSPKAASKIISGMKRSYYRDAFIAFTEAQFLQENDGCGKILCDYVRQELNTATEKTEASLWDQDVPIHTFSETELDSLIKSQELLRLHHKLLLKDEIDQSTLDNKRFSVAELLRLGLATLHKDKLVSCNKLHRFPKAPTASRPELAAASRYYKKTMETYLVESGDSLQDISFSLQVFPKNTAKKLIEQMDAFKQKMLSMVPSNPREEDSAPVVYVAFARELDWNDF